MPACKQVRRQLPAEAEPPQIELQRADRPYASFYIAFTSRKLNISALTDWLTRNIQLSCRFSRCATGRYRSRSSAGHACLDLAPSLERIELDAGDVYNALRRNNYLAAIGRVRNDAVQIDLLTTPTSRRSTSFKI